MQNKIKGKWGEDIAKNYLVKNGYKILETNFHFSRNGEVDIIAMFEGKIIFVEVKARTSVMFGHPFEAITRAKMNKIFACAQFYLSSCNVKYSGFQIDAISILLNEKPPKIEHIKNLSF